MRSVDSTRDSFGRKGCRSCVQALLGLESSTRQVDSKTDLYRFRSRLVPGVLQKGDEKALGLNSDPSDKTHWLYTSQAIFELVVSEEDRDVWRIMLKREEYEPSLKFAKVSLFFPTVSPPSHSNSLPEFPTERAEPTFTLVRLRSLPDPSTERPHPLRSSRRLLRSREVPSSCCQVRVVFEELRGGGVEVRGCWGEGRDEVLSGL